jgi:phosphate-selective porin OprO/OprP
MLDGARIDTRGDATERLSEVRRARIELEIGFSPRLEFDTSYELTEPELRSTYLTWTAREGIDVIVGKDKEPLVLDELTSSKYTTFMESAMITAFAPGRSYGISVVHGAGNRWLQAGLYENETHTPGGDGHALSARAVWFEAERAERILHLGGYGTWRSVDDQGSVRFRERPESHLFDTRLVDTGTIDDVDDVIIAGLETGLVRGPWHAQAELVSARVGRDRGRDLRFHGGYLQGGYVITGESRRYRTRGAEFREIRPARPWGSGGHGAVEVALRLSTIDLTDGDAVGGRESNLTVGLNWYPNRYLRFMVNFVNVLDVDRPGHANDGSDPRIVQVRAQAAF